MRSPDISRMDEPGVAQDSKVMGHAGLGATAVQLAARCFSDARKIPDNLYTHGVAQGVKQTLEDEVGWDGVFEGTHVSMITKAFNECYISNTIEQANQSTGAWTCLPYSNRSL